MSGATRRDALRVAALAGGALAVPALMRPAAALAQDDDEADLEDFLVMAIHVEQVAVLAYATAVEAKDLDRDLKRTLEGFGEHEQLHANAMRSALDSLGLDPPDPPSDLADTAALEGLEDADDEGGLRSELTKVMGGLERAKGVDELLELLLNVEDLQWILYLGDTPVFESEDLLRTGAEIAACQAQHGVVLKAALGSPPADSVADLTGDQFGN